jgi:microcystin degradation protein MlrC
MAGALGVFATRPEVRIVPTFSARARTSGGTLIAADWKQLADEFVGSVRQAFSHAGPIDAVYLSLHGAMSAEGEDDPEGYLLQEVRRIIGPEMPMVVSLDLHGILTDRMVENSDAIVAYHTYPHVDFASTGERAARLLLKILDGEAQPVTVVVPIPALVRGNELITATGLFGRMISSSKGMEESGHVLSAGMFIGNPFTDVRDLRSNSFVVTNGDAARAEAEAVRLAQDFWQVHEQLLAGLTSVADAVEQVKAAKGTVILTDAADATSSGASGDSNAIPAALMEAGYTGRVLTPIVDPEAVQDAIRAGVGSTVQTTVGGKLDTARFKPLPISARVHMISDGKFICESNGAQWDSGLSAVLVAGSYTFVLISRPVSFHDRSLFWAHGQDPTRFDVVVVKSPHCQHHMFDAWAERNINVDAPGSTSANLPYLGHTKCARPIFPLDPGVTFTPKPKLFRRTNA